MIPLAELHQTDEPLTDSEEEDEVYTVGGIENLEAKIAGGGDWRSRRRQSYRRRRGGVRRRPRRKNPFTEIAARDIPALADVLLEEDEMFDAEEVEQAEEEAADIACTDNESEEEDDEDENLGCHVTTFQTTNALATL